MSTTSTQAGIAETAERLRAQDPEHQAWARGHGLVRHIDATQVRVHELAEELVRRRTVRDRAEVYARLAAADRLTSAGMWLVVHLTYAREVRTDGEPLTAQQFKAKPEGHTGGALNMVPAYVGYLAANALSGTTRSWIMGQGHCVAAIDSVNLLAGNVTREHAERYDLSDAGLGRFVRDFYSYELLPDGSPAAPLGSHVGPHTAGGLLEGGYLGFAELLHVHMPMPGEALVAFLSDGAFEEQRGSDWAPRWWRAEDSGLLVPVMIANGRRIDQRTTTAQSGGSDWLRRHLELNGFDPFELDGRDPAAFAWAILEGEERLARWSRARERGEADYPAPLPYAIAETVKGWGFPGAGTNRAHNLPLRGNPSQDEVARKEFNDGARALWVAPDELEQAAGRLATHTAQQRPLERDHPLAARPAPELHLPEPPWSSDGGAPMRAIDATFLAIVERNPHLRPRVGNPDEMRSNRMDTTLDHLRHRVGAPEPGVAEDVLGGVVTVLNEEAVVCAALGNKAGINLVVTYEAFAVKMLGAARQELIFARAKRDVGRPPTWLSVPIVVTSHTWENGKNEYSHQDPSFAEALLGEMSDAARVLFPADWNSACATLCAVYRGHGEVVCLVVPKLEIPALLDPDQAQDLAQRGALRLAGRAESPVQLIAVGAHQLVQALRARERLEQRGLDTSVICLHEPGRFREPRDEREAAFVASDSTRRELFGAPDVRVILSHTRPGPLIGALRLLDLGAERTRLLGYQNRGGTLDLFGMLFANRCTWAHAVREVAHSAGRSAADFLDPAELAAVSAKGDPRALEGKSK